MSSSLFIDYVKEKIELCIQKYMSLEETLTYLHEDHHIPHHITTTIWKHLQSENSHFFEEYNKRCEVARKIARFNNLLAQQMDLMQRFRQTDLRTTAPELHHHHHHHHDQDQIHDLWIGSNGIANREETTLPCLIDRSLFAATPQSNSFTSRFDDHEQFARDLDQLQQRLELKVQRQQQPQHPMDQQEVYFHQQHESTTLILQGDRPTNNNGSAPTYDL